MPLKGIYLRVTIPKVPRCGIMATQPLATLTTVHHLLKREIVVYLVNLRHLFHSIPMDVCFVSQLNRWFMSHSVSCLSVARSFRRLILLDFPFRLVVMLDGVLKARRRDKDEDQINILEKNSWIVKIVLALCPLCFLPHVLNLGTRFLFSGGELSQP